MFAKTINPRSVTSSAFSTSKAARVGLNRRLNLIVRAAEPEGPSSPLPEPPKAEQPVKTSSPVPEPPKTASGDIKVTPSFTFDPTVSPVRFSDSEKDPKIPERAIQSDKAWTFGEAMRADGPAPELINGRLAMLGFVAGAAAEIFTGEPILQQFGQAPLPIALTFALIIAASWIPLFNGTKEKGNAFWNPRAEVFNGQMAMLGFAIMIITESLFGRPTF